MLASVAFHEVPACYDSKAGRTLLVQGSDSGRSNGPATSSWQLDGRQPYGSGQVVGPCANGSSDGRLFTWKVSEHQPKVIDLVELSHTENLTHNSLRIQFPTEVFPSVCAHSGAGQVQSGCWFHLYTLTQDGVAYRIDVPPPDKTGASVLARLAKGNISSVPLDEELLTNVQSPTSLACSGLGLLVGGSNGGVLCVPLNAFASTDQARFEPIEGVTVLKDPILQRLWSGLVNLGQRAKSLVQGSKPNPVRAMAVDRWQGRAVLLVLHEDYTLRMWDLSKQQSVLATTLSGRTKTLAASAVPGEEHCAPQPLG
eukprot:CAMPEP_0118953616 /NCGR_PEP_ID=MMETSP1169-20130426/56877_1 /TAXON_ID=36882 /ORGANISM="Pyramimonas obovata, Strain CCMP722" /LENGTH=311 /DNA_ID=CAMNT_0006901121 /DNA_START=218 /DNA_END=1149 /DNA_ORIENTATION=-